MTTTITIDLNGLPTWSEIPRLEAYSETELAQVFAHSEILQQYHQQSIRNQAEIPIKLDRNRGFLRLGLATYFDRLHPRKICRAWSEFAEKLLIDSLREHFPKGDVHLLSMGKLGSQELNLSSDVDICLVHTCEGEIALNQFQKWNQFLNHRDSTGFLFRTDFNLRPGGRFGAMVVSVDEYLDYYLNYGENWERMALLRLNCVSEFADKERLLAGIEKFCFRKFIDHGLSDSLLELRREIFRTAATAEQENNLKLRPGGIRDVELFVHALQIIYGGKQPNLRVRSIEVALHRIADQGILPQDIKTYLTEHYWVLRKLENYTQALSDQQTHLLEINDKTPEAMVKHFENLDFSKCADIINSLIEKPKPQSQIGAQPIPDDIFQRFANSPILSRKKGTYRRLQQEVLRQIIGSWGVDSLHEPAMQRLESFFNSFRAKGELYETLVRFPKLIQKISFILRDSEFLSQILIRRPDYLDSLAFQQIEDRDYENDESYFEYLIEKKRLAELSLGGDFLSGRPWQEISVHLSQIGDQIIGSLLMGLNRIHDTSIRVLTLGTWGGMELGFSSDLDFILVSKSEPGEAELRVARKLALQITQTLRGGSLYSIDQRLRPHGGSGMVVVSERELKDYVSTKAEAWRLQSYTKARILGTTGNYLRAELLERKITNKDREDWREVREKVVAQVPRDKLSLKLSKGGLLDVELALQAWILLHQAVPELTTTDAFFDAVRTHTAKSSTEDLHKLQANWLELRIIQQRYFVVENLMMPEFIGPDTFPDPSSQGVNASFVFDFHKVNQLFKDNEDYLLCFDCRS